ncbi:hypothetical protein RND81_08G061900 [Saponaria officinalis]|uniref:RanBP2-type domain-containing protein n=2 Tax=Saponaria officinalis TaxID=3572 RepID=A0AAW1J692_SAPOF
MFNFSPLVQFTSVFITEGARMSSPGDWLCGACQHVNFKKRESCQKCNFPKYGTQADIPYYAYTNAANRTTEVLAGDWYCQSINCGAHNYASRTNCFRCGNYKCDQYASVGYNVNDMISGGGYAADYHQQQQLLPPGWKSGDWICVRYVPFCSDYRLMSSGVSRGFRPIER